MGLPPLIVTISIVGFLHWGASSRACLNINPVVVAYVPCHEIFDQTIHILIVFD